MDKVRTKLQPDVDTFLESLDALKLKSTATQQQAQGGKTGAKLKSQHKQQQQQKPTAVAAAPSTELEQEHVRLGELLLQSLLRLDAIHSEGEWEQARKERKGAVKEVQALLDRLDGGWRARAKA